MADGVFPTSSVAEVLPTPLVGAWPSDEPSKKEEPTPTADDNLINALNNLQFDAARSAILEVIKEKVGTKRSWDSPQYTTSRQVHKQINQKDRDDVLTFFALDALQHRYFLRDADNEICEAPQDFFARVATGVACGGHTAVEVETNQSLYLEVCAHAQELYDSLSQLHFLFATPILTNAGTNRGAMISCFLSEADDSIEGICDTNNENAVLAKGGGGLGTYWGNLRGQKAKLSRGGVSSGQVPFLKISESFVIAVQQTGTNRRGAGAAYSPVNHPDIESFIDIRKPEGIEERRCAKLNHGVTLSDDFMEAVEKRGPWNLICPHTGQVTKTIDAYTLFKKIIMNRVTTGEPYMLFVDTVNKVQPLTNILRNEEVKTSNLCIEVTLITKAAKLLRKWSGYFAGFKVTVDKVVQRGRTAVCCLGSLNYGRYDEWKHYEERLAYNVMKGLDNVLSAFIREQKSNPKYENAVYSASQARDVGLGVMGWFDYLQQRGIPFETVEARSHNKIVFKKFGEITNAASARLAVERGLPPDTLSVLPAWKRAALWLASLVGLSASVMPRLVDAALMFRNVNRQAIAPTASIGTIAGSSPSIESWSRNVFKLVTLSGTAIMRNPQLVALIQRKYPKYDTLEVWKDISQAAGSVQHLEWMSEDDKKVFKTAYELNQREIVLQAGHRQPYISQSQSLNVFFLPGDNKKISAKYLYDVHMSAWKLGVKSLYYLRAESNLKVANMVAKRKQQEVAAQMAIEECAVCQ